MHANKVQINLLTLEISTKHILLKNLQNNEE